MSITLTGKTLLLIALIVLGLVSGIGVAAWVQVTGGAPSGEVHVSLPPTSSNFDPRQPASPSDVSARTIMTLAFEGLVRYNWDGELIPGVAESLPAGNGEGTLYTFVLRNDAVWSDGTAITSQQFVRSIKTLLLGGSPIAPLFHNIMGARSFAQKGLIDGEVSGLETPSPDTLIIRLEKPQPSFLHLLTMPALSPTPPRQTGELTSASAGRLYNGPYVIGENLGTQVTLLQNEHYWGDGPRFRKLVLELIDDPQTRYDRYKSGSLDVTEVRITPNTLPESFKSQYFEGIEDGTIGLTFRVDRPPFDQPELRRAIAFALDRQRFVNVVLDDKGRSANTWIPPTLPGFREESPAAQTFDLNRAKTVLNSSQSRAVKSLTFQVEDNDLGSAIGEYVATQLKLHLGITVTVEPVSADTYRDFLAEGRLNFSYIYWQSSYLNPANWLRDLFHSRGAFNYTGYDNSELDDILDQALSTEDPLEGPRLWNQAHDMVLSDAVIVPIAYLRRVAFVDSRLGKLKFGPMDGGFPGSLSIRDNVTQ